MSLRIEYLFTPNEFCPFGPTLSIGDSSEPLWPDSVYRPVLTFTAGNIADLLKARYRLSTADGDIQFAVTTDGRCIVEEWTPRT